MFFAAEAEKKTLLHTPRILSVLCGLKNIESHSTLLKIKSFNAESAELFAVKQN